MQLNQPHNQMLALAVNIVSAHVGHNDTPTKALPGLIKDIYDTLVDIGASAPPPQEAAPTHNHAVPHSTAKSHAPAEDHLVCLEDGLTMKMLKRHLITVHGLTPDQYRAKWGLPSDYPMVSADYAKLRSSLAKESGLGLRPGARLKRNRG